MSRQFLTSIQTILIHSACGGVGLAAIQIAKSLGAEVRTHALVNRLLLNHEDFLQGGEHRED